MVHTVQGFPDLRQFYRPKGQHYRPYKIGLLPSFIDEVNVRFSAVIKEWLTLPNEFIAEIRKFPFFTKSKTIQLFYHNLIMKIYIM